jgi:hypothetical protein
MEISMMKDWPLRLELVKSFGLTQGIHNSVVNCDSVQWIVGKNNEIVIFAIVDSDMNGLVRQ